MKIVTANRLSDGRVIYAGVDNQPVEHIDQASVLDDPAAADIAADATEEVATEWDRAARVGLADRRLQAAALTCVTAAAERTPAELAEPMDRLVRTVERGRCAADDFADRVVATGIAAAITEMAEGES